MQALSTYSPKLERAIRTTIRLHEGHARKTDKTLPYITHLFHVAFLVQAHGFDEDTVIAALLHDTLEDTEYTPEELSADFGEHICDIVQQVTEKKFFRWEDRKANYLESIQRGSVEAKAVCCADKLHNLSTIIAEYRERGDALWKVFSRGKETTLLFYEHALDAISQDWDHAIVDEYRTVLQTARAALKE